MHLNEYSEPCDEEASSGDRCSVDEEADLRGFELGQDDVTGRQFSISDMLEIPMRVCYCRN